MYTAASFLISPTGDWVQQTGRREIKISKMASRGFLVGDHNIRPRRPVRYVASKQTKAAKRKKKKPEWDVSTSRYIAVTIASELLRRKIDIIFVKLRSVQNIEL